MASATAASSASSPGPPWSPARCTTSIRRQRFVADSGRDSSISTVSPTCASLVSSCALKRVVRRMTRLYSRWRVRRSTDTTIVLSILSLTTRPTLVLRCPCTGVVAPAVGIPTLLLRRARGGGPLALDGEDPGDRPSRRRDLAVILQLPGRQREPGLPEVLLGLLQAILELTIGELPGLTDLHRWPPSPSSCRGGRRGAPPAACGRRGASPRRPPRARRPPSRTGSDPGARRRPSGPARPCPNPCASRQASSSPACPGTRGSRSCRRA